MSIATNVAIVLSGPGSRTNNGQNDQSRHRPARPRATCKILSRNADPRGPDTTRTERPSCCGLRTVRFVPIKAPGQIRDKTNSRPRTREIIDAAAFSVSPPADRRDLKGPGQLSPNLSQRGCATSLRHVRKGRIPSDTKRATHRAASRFGKIVKPVDRLFRRQDRPRDRYDERAREPSHAGSEVNAPGCINQHPHMQSPLTRWSHHTRSVS